VVERQDDARQNAQGARPWVRTLAMVGLFLLALAALAETVTAGALRPLTGALILLAVAAFAVAGVGKLTEPSTPVEEHVEDAVDEEDVEDTDAAVEDDVERAPGGPEGVTSGGTRAQAERTGASPARTTPRHRAREAREPVREAPERQLPRLSDLTDVALGATATQFTAREQAPYVRRPAVDGRLATLVGTSGAPYPFVVVVGAAKAGKTRTAIEAVRAALGAKNPPVFAPRTGGELAEVVREHREVARARQRAEPRRGRDTGRGTGRPPDRSAGQEPTRRQVSKTAQKLAAARRETVSQRIPGQRSSEWGTGSQPWLIWLDDLRAADLMHLSNDVLDAALERGVIVATMTDLEWDRVMASRGEVVAPAREALRRATKVWLDSRLTASEKNEAERMYPHIQVTSSIGEALIAGEQLIARFHSGRESSPAGYSIVQAAVDARRAGLGRPLTEAELRGLYPLYLRRVRMDLDPTTRLFEEGLAWAKEPVSSGVGLLVSRNGTPGLEAIDYVVAMEEGADGREARPVFDAMWQELIAAVPARDAFAIGVGACLRDNSAAAEAAFRKVIEEDHAGPAPQAAVNLGLLLWEQGDIAGARSAFRQAMESRDADQAPRAADHLGTLLLQVDDVSGARAAYQEAMDSGHPDVVPIAADHLGTLLHQLGDVAGARSAYQRAVESGHPAVVPRAALNLGSLLLERGDAAGAEAAFRRAVDSRHPDVVPEAALRLGSLLEDRGDRAGAETAYRRAFESGREDVAGVAAMRLGSLLREQGDLTGARVALQAAVDADDPQVTPKAALQLGTLLMEQGDLSGAEKAYEKAMDSEDEDVVPMAAMQRGSLLKQRGDLAGAQVAYRRAMESGHRDVAPRAANNLGVLLAQQNDDRAARAAYERAVDSGHPDVAPLAANNLGVLLAQHNDVEGARRAYELAVESGHEDAAPRAALNLGMLLDAHGDVAGARRAYQRAVDSGHTDVVPVAAVNLGVLLREQKDFARARAAFRQAIDAGYLDIPPVPPDRLRLLMAEDGGVVRTQPAWLAGRGGLTGEGADGDGSSDQATPDAAIRVTGTPTDAASLDGENVDGESFDGDGHDGRVATGNGSPGTSDGGADEQTGSR